MESSILTLFSLILTSVLIWAFVGIIWSSCRKFFHRSYSYIDITFILSYFLEQASLVIILARYSYNPQIVVGLFSIIVVTTAALQNRAWESRIKEISETTTEQKILIERTFTINQRLVEENTKLKENIKNLKEYIKE